jgi:hypothetical protein
MCAWHWILSFPLLSNTIYETGATSHGYFNYYAVPDNSDSLNSFRSQVTWHWYRALRRRSQRTRMTWERFRRLVDLWIPSATILHPYPSQRFDAIHPR